MNGEREGGELKVQQKDSAYGLGTRIGFADIVMTESFLPTLPDEED